MPLDPTSTEESTPWDPITGKLRAHANLKMPQGTRNALEKNTLGGTTHGMSGVSTRCPTGPGTAATSAFSTRPGSPRSQFDVMDDRTQLHNGTMMRGGMAKSTSSPGLPGGAGHRAVRFMNEHRDQAAMELDPARYDVRPGDMRAHHHAAMMADQGRYSDLHPGDMRAAMMADQDLYDNDTMPRGFSTAPKVADENTRLMHMKADPRNDLLNDGSGHNVDADGQTMLGVEIKERFSNMRDAFLKIDENFDGKITPDELVRACMQWNVPKSEALRVMNSVDVDGKGFIDFDEFARRFDPYLEITPDDDELLRLYQEGIMAGEEPLKLYGNQHPTSTSEPLVDEAAHYRTQNGDLRGRLARAMRRIKELEEDLHKSRAHAASLENSLDKANAYNAQLEGENASLRRRLEAAEEDKRIAQDGRRRLLAELREAEEGRRDANDKAGRMADRARQLEQELDEEEAAARRWDARRRERERAAESDDEHYHRQRTRDLEQQLRDMQGAHEKDDARTVYVYGIDGCEKTKALHKALKKAGVEFTERDFHADKRWQDVVRKSDDYNESNPVYAPVVTLGGKSWWQKPSGDNSMIPFEHEVAMDLRHLLGLNKMQLDKVREDVDIDSEIYERFLTMQDAFLKLDDDRDGFVTEDEIKRMCKLWNIPEREAGRVIREGDRDNDGALDFDEFAKRFGGLFKSRGLGPLKTSSPMPHASKPRSPKRMA